MSNNITFTVDTTIPSPEKMTSVYWLYHEGVYYPKTTELSLRRNLSLTSKDFRTLLIRSVVPVLENHIPDNDFNKKIEYAPELRNLAVLRGIHGTFDLRLDKEAKLLPLVQSLRLADTYARYYEVHKIRNLFQQKRSSGLVQTSVEKFNTLYASLWGEIKDFDTAHNLRSITHRVRIQNKGKRIGREFYTTSERVAEEYVNTIIRPWFSKTPDVDPSVADKFHMLGLEFLEPDLRVDDAEFVRNERAIVTRIHSGSNPDNIIEDIRKEEASQVSTQDVIASMKRVALGAHKE